MLKKHALLISLAVVSVLLIGFAATKNDSSSDNGGTSQSAEAKTFKDIDTESPMYIGDESADVSIIQYSDFLCPSCSYFSTQTMPQVHENYIDQGKANFEFRPMAFIADGSTQAGMGAYCAVDQDMFWDYHDAVYNYVAQKVFNEGLDPTRDVILTTDIVEGIAEAIGLSPEEFDSCLESGQHLDAINDSTREANKNGVNSTPYIMVNGRKFTGNPTYDIFEAFLKASM